MRAFQDWNVRLSCFRPICRLTYRLTSLATHHPVLSSSVHTCPHIRSPVCVHVYVSASPPACLPARLHARLLTCLPTFSAHVSQSLAA
eukprot:90157-Chlamydomonas_euryale.AAC.1